MTSPQQSAAVAAAAVTVLMKITMAKIENQLQNTLISLSRSFDMLGAVIYTEPFVSYSLQLSSITQRIDACVYLRVGNSL